MTALTFSSVFFFSSSRPPSSSTLIYRPFASRPLPSSLISFASRALQNSNHHHAFVRACGDPGGYYLLHLRH